MLGKLANSWQLYCLFLSCGFGFWLGLLYELFGLCRRAAIHKTAAVLWDVAFCLLAAVLLFLFALPVSGGVLRWYIWLGAVVGFAAFHVTLGRFVKSVAAAIDRGARWLFHVLSRILQVLFRPIRSLLRMIWRRAQKMWKNIEKFFKKHLKPRRRMVYNHDDTMG